MRTLKETVINRNSNKIMVRDAHYKRYIVNICLDENEYCKALLIIYNNEIPTIESIKEEFINYVNSIIDNEIKNCTWKDHQVQLTTENQFNYKIFYDYAKSQEFKNIPITIKLNNLNNSVEYYTFHDKEEFEDFNNTWIKHIQDELNKSWNLKKLFNTEEYIELLNHII